mgnify:CR=1 FL=1
MVKAVAMYELVEKFLQEEYEDSYDSWVRSTENQAYDKKITDKEEIMNEIEEREAKKYKEMEDFWTQYGPISSILLILSTFFSCTAVLCCFKKYTLNLEKYEKSSINPMNGIAV